MIISIVVPTNRDITNFRDAWGDLIKKHNCNLILVYDGALPSVTLNGDRILRQPKDIMGKYSDLIDNCSDAVRNLGFVLAGQLKSDMIISLDDDVTPIDDPIQDHINALNKRYPTSWLSTSMTEYMRGFPYSVRDETECWVSHGVWEGVPDYDAVRQLSGPIKTQEFYRGPVPKGCLFPMSAMSLAFRIEALPFMYQFPVAYGVNRFSDIFCGIECKKDLDRMNKCAVTGFSRVYHDRQSNPYENLVKEAKGIKLNDEYGKDEYFKLAFKKRARWKEFISKLI